MDNKDNKDKKSFRITEEDIQAANEQLPAVFAMLNLYSAGHPVCPECNNDKPKTVVFKTSKSSGQPYWKCYVCSANSSAVKLLIEKGSISFTDAVDTILGRPLKGNRTVDVKAVDLSSLPEIAPPFIATVDREVYNFIRSAGSLEAAQKYWMQVAHIPSVIVAESTSTMITDSGAVQKELLARFGRDRLLACGVITIDKNGKDFFLGAHPDYPVGEWHLDPNGDVVGAQFRPNLVVKKKIDLHKAWKKHWVSLGHKHPDSAWREDWIARGEKASEAYEEAARKNPDKVGKKIPYTPPFMSFLGAGRDSLVGCGLARIKSLPKGSRIIIVEGFKDYLAARAMNVEAYAMPGTGNLPPQKVLGLFREHEMLVCLDGDAAGAKGRKVVLEYLRENEVLCREKSDLPDGFDVADVFVQRNAHTGCKCELCIAWRANHPEETPETCPCTSCKRYRARKAQKAA